MRNRFLIMNPKDNTATTLEELPEGEKIQIEESLIIIINEKIRFGHKFALKDIKPGEYVLKYGQIIGKASKDIKAGDHVHVRNVKSAYMEEEH